MKICYLTQTATDVSDYYKSFFKGKDLFFVTFKNSNPNSIGFMPKSSWSDGRNKLWEELQGKYDYYVFLDDDLLFYKFKSPFSLSPLLSYAYYRFKRKHLPACYESSAPSYFFSKLEYYLQKHKPEVLSVTSVDWDPNDKLDAVAMRKNSFVRRVGYFDAQFNVLSNYAASKILPYDTKISGWWSSQIPVYLYAFNVFASKAINLCKLGVTNSHHVGAYVENYNGVLDCKIMLKEISTATNKDYRILAGGQEKESVDLLYGSDVIKRNIPKVYDKEDYLSNYDNSLRGLENFLHDGLVP